MLKRTVLIFIIILAIFTTTINASGSNVYLCGIHHSDGADRTSWISTSKNYYINGNSASVTTKEYFSATNLASYLHSADVLVIQSHGAQNNIMAVNNYGLETLLTKTDVNGWTANYLNGTHLIFLAACECAKGGTNGNNIAKAMYNKGANTVIGYSQSVNTNVNKKFIGEFNSSYAYGVSVSTSLLVALQRVNNTYGSPYGTDSYTVFGSTSATIQSSSGVMYSYGNNITGRELYYDKKNNVVGYFDYDLARGERSRGASIDINNMVENYQLTNRYSDDNTGFIISRYNYYIDGEIKTSDRVCVIKNINGDVVSYVQPEKGLFENLRIHREDINEAIREATKQLIDEGCSKIELLDTMIVKIDDGFAVECSFNVDCDEYKTVEVIDVLL